VIDLKHCNSFHKAYLKNSISWDITPCSPLKVNGCFGVKRLLHLQGQRINQGRHQQEAGSKQSLFFYLEAGGDMFIQNVGWLSESESESGLLYDWRFTANKFVSATCPLRFTTSNFIFQLNTCGYSPHVTSSLTRGCVCRLQLLLVLASTVILRSESRGTHDHILVSQIRDSPSLGGQVLVFLSPRNRVTCLSPRHWVLFVSWLSTY
jgi:hypothetical protein